MPTRTKPASAKKASPRKAQKGEKEAVKPVTGEQQEQTQQVEENGREAEIGKKRDAETAKVEGKTEEQGEEPLAKKAKTEGEDEKTKKPAEKESEVIEGETQDHPAEHMYQTGKSIHTSLNAR